MGHAGGEQTDGAEFVRLRQLRFQGDALRNVVHQNDAAHGNKIAREQRSDSDVGGAHLAGARGEGELIVMMDALLVAEAVESVDKLGGEDRTQLLPDGLAAAEGVHGLHLRVPAFDALVQIESKDADVDGLNDVFVEFLEALEFADFFFEPRVKAGVLECDADVAREGFEQFNIFAGEEIAADGAAQSDDGDGACSRSVLNSTRQVVVQIEQGSSALLSRGQMEGGLGIFQENVRVVLSAVEVQELQCHVVLRGQGLGRQAMRGGQLQTPGFFGFRGKKNSYARHEQSARQALDDGFQ